jgi:CUT domain.
MGERNRSHSPEEHHPPQSHAHHHHLTSDVPTISVSPFKVRRLGEFDQETVVQLADALKDWLDKQTRVSQGLFAQKILARSQGTLSLLLTRKSAPISSSGEEVWRKIRDFLQDERKQQELILFAHQH